MSVRFFRMEFILVMDRTSSPPPANGTLPPTSPDQFKGTKWKDKEKEKKYIRNNYHSIYQLTCVPALWNDTNHVRMTKGQHGRYMSCRSREHNQRRSISTNMFSCPIGDIWIYRCIQNVFFTYQAVEVLLE